MRDISWGKWGAIAGFLFAILMVGGLLLAIGDAPDGNKSDEAHVEWWSDSGNQTMALVGSYLVVLSGLAFIAFMTQVRARLLTLEGGGGTLAAAAYGAAVAFVALLVVGILVVVSVASNIKFGEQPVPDPGFMRQLPGIGYAIILVGGGLTASFCIAAVSWGILRTGAFPRWLAWLGFVCAIALLFAVVFIPMIALPIWAIAASVELWRRPALAGDRV